MKTKLVKDLEIGDKVNIAVGNANGEGTYIATGEVVKKVRRSLFQAKGGCFQLDVKVLNGSSAGRIVRDQFHAGADEAELAEQRPLGDD